MRGEAGPPPEDAQNSEFFKRGRPDFAICVSNYTDAAASSSSLTTHVTEAVEKNKATLWKNSFLAEEDIKIDSPCPKGPTFDESTTDVMDHLGSIPIVEEPGPYILYVHVLEPSYFAIIERLKLGGRIMPQEFVDPDPSKPGGNEQRAAGLYLTLGEFQQPEFLARQVAEAIGCTEGCAGPVPGSEQ
jgi:hypothetical protein